MTTLTRDELLILLIEECSEVIHAATKCLRFGWDSDHSVGYGQNNLILAKEMGEVDAIRDALGLDDGMLVGAYMEGWKDKIDRAIQAKELYPHGN